MAPLLPIRGREAPMLEQLAGWITTTIDHPGYPGVLAVLAVLYYVHRLRAAGGGSPGGAVPE